MQKGGRMKGPYSRRDVLKTAGALGLAAAFGGVPSGIFAEERKLYAFPEKTDLILLTSRPPQLETPLLTSAHGNSKSAEM
jgi:hypothetical protein